jgi:two-component system, chemotaxis family, protein-glutamate methylesterase/glutaminase
VMVSSLSLEEGSLVFSALQAGAFDYLQKPKMEDKSEFVESLTERLAIAAVSVHSPAVRSFQVAGPKRAVTAGSSFPKEMLWCLGASTGGTQALTEVFTSLPTEIPPTVVVQHIPPVFSKSFALLVNELCPFEVKEACDGDLLKPNTVYIAPGGFQTAVVSTGSGELKIVVSDDQPVNRFKPSVDFLFKSVASLKGHQVIAAILTGMGKDGAAGLLELKNVGAMTLSQDEATCTVYGMPRAAEEIGASRKVVPLGEIAQTLVGGVKYFSKAS